MPTAILKTCHTPRAKSSVSSSKRQIVWSPRDQIFNALGQAFADNFDRAVDVRVSRLRTKLRDDPQNPKIIKTIYGAGYIFIGSVE